MESNKKQKTGTTKNNNKFYPPFSQVAFMFSDILGTGLTAMKNVCKHTEMDGNLPNFRDVADNQTSEMLLKVLLKSWNVLSLFQFLSSRGIDLTCLKYIEESDYGLMMKLAEDKMFGDLLTFRHFQRKWKAKLNAGNTCLDGVDRCNVTQ
ncbi:hypothetical protein Bhyg_11318 [Pseudolycoriella hygida]|uniref:Uncharacterized protein n=1 Tax=Pseudolycoriella hygida TaxID=35572 RepID=A0A9Q0RZT7_9DIPT|nr:hypothetical protein Bhyg_11318 [Pseudolycoriella hygida]